MDTDDTQETNVDRLLEHLDNESLAAKLVNTLRDAAEIEETDAMTKVLRARLDSIRAGISNAET